MIFQTKKNIFVVVVCLFLSMITLYYDSRLRNDTTFLPDSLDKDHWERFLPVTASKPQVSMRTCKVASALHGLSEELPSDDPRLIAFIRERVLVPPSVKPYNLQRGPDFDTSDGQAQIIDTILGRKRNGFFVECGAYTGDVLSNTLLFETQRGWKGLLIEPDKRNFAKTLTRNRKVHAANSCLGESKGSQNIIYAELNSPWASHIIDPYREFNTRWMKKLEKMSCYPLESFLLALNTSTVDYLSLDVEGSEYKVLQSTNWDKLDIKTLSVEWNLIPEGRDALRTLMESKGYVLYMEFNKIHTHDFIFVKKGLLPETEAGKELPILREDNNLEQLYGRDLIA